MSRLETFPRQTWTVAELRALRAEVDAALSAALIAQDIVRSAMRFKSDPDVFYPSIVSAYRRFDLVIGRPVVNIALAADVPHSTAARWVRVARSMGHLEAAS